MPTRCLENQINELSKIMADLHLCFTQPIFYIENCNHGTPKPVRHEWINPKAKEMCETCGESIIYLQKKLHEYECERSENDKVCLHWGSTD